MSPIDPIPALTTPQASPATTLVGHHVSDEYAKVLHFTITHGLYIGTGSDSSAADDLIAHCRDLEARLLARASLGTTPAPANVHLSINQDISTELANALGHAIGCAVEKIRAEQAPAPVIPAPTVERIMTAPQAAIEQDLEILADAIDVAGGFVAGYYKERRDALQRIRTALQPATTDRKD